MKRGIESCRAHESKIEKQKERVRETDSLLMIMRDNIQWFIQVKIVGLLTC